MLRLMEEQQRLKLILEEGEGLKAEFKERLSKIDREIVAMANAAGGSIFLGVNDSGQIIGIDITNQLKSQIQDITRNCDPAINVHLIAHHDLGVLEIQVEEGQDKPYKCKDGFFLRTGPSSQKLNRDEIIQFMNDSGKLHFDESINKKFDFDKDFSEAALNDYLKRCGVSTQLPYKDVLISLGVAIEAGKKLQMNNAGVLFFANDPQRFFLESYITGVRYNSYDRYSIIDHKDCKGNPIEQFEAAMAFLTRHMSNQAVIPSAITSPIGQREDIYDYPIPALREAVINAIIHRDYHFDNSHIYIHMYPDRVEIQNPGGLPHGITLENLSKRSVRRNRLIADLFHRAGLIEKVGSGIDRMKQALRANNNPDLEISTTNFFDLRFYIRETKTEALQLTARQRLLYNLLKERGEISKREVAMALNVSDDTALRELKALIKQDLINVIGEGKSTIYQLR